MSKNHTTSTSAEMLQEFATEFALAQSASTARSRMRPAFPAAPPISTAAIISNPSELLSQRNESCLQGGLALAFHRLHHGLSIARVDAHSFPGCAKVVEEHKVVEETQLSCQFVQKTDKALNRAAQMPHSPEGLFLLVPDVTSFSGNIMFCAPQFVPLEKTPQP